MTAEDLIVVNPGQGLLIQQAVENQIRHLVLSLIGRYNGQQLDPKDAYAGIAAIAALHAVYGRLGKSQDSNHK